MTTPRVTIRKAIYHGDPGFTVTSRAGGIFGTSIFVETRAAAEACKARVQKGEEVTLADMMVLG